MLCKEDPKWEKSVPTDHWEAEKAIFMGTSAVHLESIQEELRLLQR